MSHEPKSGQYLGHALLEVALVIVGILVALQVNNWNEERIEQQRVSDLARALIVDLERDISDLEEILPQMQRVLRNVETFTAYTRGKTLREIDNLDLDFLLHGMGYQSFNWHRAAFETLTSTGALQNIRNPEIVTALTRYDSFTRHLDHDNQGDIERIWAVRSLAQHVVDSNYPRDGEAQAVWDQAEDQPQEFPPKALHEFYKDKPLQLLATDLDQVKVLTNAVIDLRRIRPRPMNEVPAIIKEARQLIELLEAEYPQ